MVKISFKIKMLSDSIIETRRGLNNSDFQSAKRNPFTRHSRRASGPLMMKIFFLYEASYRYQL